jgi:hypothetical protein
LTTGSENEKRGQKPFKRTTTIIATGIEVIQMTTIAEMFGVALRQYSQTIEACPRDRKPSGLKGAIEARIKNQ